MAFELLKFFLFHGTTKTVFEFIDTTCGINELGNSRKERMRLVRDIKFHQRVFISVLPFNRFFGWSARRAQKSILVGHVFKNNQSVIVRVNVFLHNVKIGVQR